MPDRRTFTVLGALIVGMTLTSILLLLLTPGPHVPVSGVKLQAVERESDRTDKLFATLKPRSWKAIVIHDSGNLSGSAETINLIHQQIGRGGLGYHFIVNNGSLADDGLIDIGFRWQRQFAGHYVEGDGADWFNRNAIGIDLIGDIDQQQFTQAQLRQLVWLVRQLQDHFDIPREAVIVDLGSDPQQSVQRFPYIWFRQQLNP